MERRVQGIGGWDALPSRQAIKQAAATVGLDGDVS